MVAQNKFPRKLSLIEFLLVMAAWYLFIGFSYFTGLMVIIIVIEVPLLPLWLYVYAVLFLVCAIIIGIYEHINKTNKYYIIFMTLVMFINYGIIYKFLPVFFTDFIQILFPFITF